MSRTLYKYSFPIADAPTTVETHVGGKIVHGACHGGQLSLWVELDPDQPKEARTFRVFGTGQPIPEGYEHRATAPDGRMFVWHIYEKTD